MPMSASCSARCGPTGWRVVGEVWLLLGRQLRDGDRVRQRGEPPARPRLLAPEGVCVRAALTRPLAHHATLLIESLLLSVAAALVGLGLSLWGVDVLLGRYPVQIPIWMQFTVDGRVLAFTLAVAPGHQRAVRTGTGLGAGADGLNEPSRRTPAARTACAARSTNSIPTCRCRPAHDAGSGETGLLAQASHRLALRVVFRVGSPWPRWVIYAVMAATSLGALTRSASACLGRPALDVLTGVRQAWAAGLGLILGLGANFGLLRLLASQLYEVAPGPAHVRRGLLLILVIALAACYLPRAGPPGRSRGWRCDASDLRIQWTVECHKQIANRTKTTIATDIIPISPTTAIARNSVQRSGPGASVAMQEHGAKSTDPVLRRFIKANWAD